MIEGPASWLVASDQRMSLDAGRLAANVPAKAVGFTVATPTAEVVDLGTEFGVQVDEEQATTISVTQGAVDLVESGPAAANAATSRRQRVRAGQALVASRSRQGQWLAEPIHYDPTWTASYLAFHGSSALRERRPGPVQWAAPSLAIAAADISTVGVLFDAAAFFPHEDLNVGGVRFRRYRQKDGASAPFLAQFGGHIQVEIDFPPEGAIFPQPPRDDFERLLNHAGYSTQQSDPLSIIIDGLTPGGRYQVQIMMPNWDTTDHRTRFYDDYGSDVTLRQGDITAPPQYVVGTFIASGNEQRIHFQGIGTAGHGIVAALQVRLLSD